ncbi:homocitrate synthase [Mycolicibacterium sp. CBM1]
MTPHSTTIAEPLPRFRGPLPAELREHCETMPWSAFTARYSATGGPVRLGSWECDDADRAASRIGPQPRRFRATLAIGDRIETAIAHASGPLAALTAMLYERGIGVEMIRFHQLTSGRHTATFMQGCNGFQREWAMGWSEDPTESALRAMISCANRLLAN